MTNSLDRLRSLTGGVSPLGVQKQGPSLDRLKSTLATGNISQVVDTAEAFTPVADTPANNTYSVLDLESIRTDIENIDKEIADLTNKINSAGRVNSSQVNNQVSGWVAQREDANNRKQAAQAMESSILSALEANGYDDPNFWGRLKNTATGFVSSWGGQMVDAARTLSQSAMANYNERNKMNADFMGDAANIINNEIWANKAAELQAYYADQEAKALKGENKLSQALQGAADDLALKGAEDIATAKMGLGNAGKYIVDAGVALGQTGLDIATGGGIKAATKGVLSPMSSFATRTFGGSTMQARQEGANLDEQIAYGTLSAAKEIAVEKLFSVGKIFQNWSGKGVAGDWTEDTIKKVVNKLAKTDKGRSVLTHIANAGTGAAGEFTEEVIAGAINPVLQRATYNPDAKWDWEDIIYEGLIALPVGGIISGVSPVDITPSNNAPQTENQTAQQVQNNPVMNVSSAQAKAPVEAENLSLLAQRDAANAILGSSIGREYVKNTYGNETNFRNAVKEANPQLNDVQAYVVMANEVKNNLANNTYTDKNAVKEQARIAKLPQLPNYVQEKQMAQDIQYSIVPEGNKKIVVVDNPDVSTKLSDTEKEMLSLFKNLTGENAVISESDNSRISVNRRAVKEFLRSDYVQTLSKDLKNVVYVTGRQLDELIKASEPALSYENTDPKHTKDASLGWEHREVIFESPVTKNGKTQWKRFNAMLIVRKNNMGNYSHGIIGIQKKGPAAYGMAQNEAAIKSAEPSFDTKISQKSDGVNRNFMQNGENNTQRSVGNYDDLLNEGRSNRSVGERAGEQTGSIQETAGSSTQRRAEAQPAGKENRSGNDGNVPEGRKRVTIRNKISIAPVMLKEETQEMSDIRKRAKELGLKDVVFMYGYGTDLKTNEEFRGAYDSESKTVYIQVDNSEATIEQIFQHESYHYAVDKNPKLVRETIAKIRERYPDNQELQSIYDLYADAYTSIYGNSKYKIFEEVLADAYAGLNSFTGSEIVEADMMAENDVAENGDVRYSRKRQLQLPEQEYARLSAAINTWKVGKQLKDGTNYVYLADNLRTGEPAAFYLYYQGEYGAFSVFKKLVVDMNDEQIQTLERMIDDGDIWDHRSFSRYIKVYQNGQRTDNVDLSNVGNGKESIEAGRVDSGETANGSAGSFGAGSNDSRILNEEAGNEPAFSLGEKPRMSVKENAVENNQKALQHFGKTYRWSETGYLLLNGDKLDFSGKNDGAPGGSRTIDHRDISDALGDDYGDGTYSGAMISFMNEGNIRISPESGGIDISVLPTQAQFEALSDYITRERGEVILDISSKNGENIVSVEYPKGTKSAKVINDIKQYFADGTIPQVSQLAQFRYSLKDGVFNNYEPFNKETLNNLKMRGGIIITSEKDLRKCINEALETDKKENVYLGAISDIVKSKIEGDIGQKIFKDRQYTFVVSYDDIRHISKHFDSVDKIIEALSKLYDMLSTYDNIDFKDAGAYGKRLIIDKEFPGENFKQVDIVSASNKAIDLVTLYISKKGIKKESQSVPPATQSSLQRGSTFSNDSLAQNDKTVNADYAQDTENDTDIRFSVKQDVKQLIDIANEEPPADTNLPNIKPKEAKKGDRESAFPENLKGASIFDERFKDLAVENSSISSYNAIANKDTMQEALLKLDKEGADAVEKFRNKNPKNMSAIDIAMGFILMHRYQAVGNYEGMIAITQKLREAGTAGGQTVQLFSILGRMTPDGMVYYAQKELSKAWDEVVKGKTRQWAEEHKDDYKLTEEEIESIVRDVSFAAQLPNGRDRNILLAGVSQLIADKIQKTGGQQLKAWARISMLLNPKTQVRNVLGNAIIMPQHMISDFIGSKIDKQVAKTTNVRTTGTFSKAAFAGMKKGFYESFDDFRRGINTRNMDGDRFEIGQGKIFNDDTAKGRALNALDRTLSFLLDAGDRTFYETWFINSLNNQMRLNKATEPTAHMIEIATQEALQRTWQDENAYTKTVSAIRKAFNAVNIKGYGLGDVIMPFVKTPANLTKALIDFSPIGFINAITRKAVVLKRSIDNGEYTPAMQREFVGAISKGITGTMLMIAYWCLASLGKLTGGEDEDKDVAYFEKNIMGIAPYSFRIGDTSVSYDWMQPLGGTAAMVADVYDAIKDGKYKGIFKGTLGERGKEAANIVWDAAVAAGDVLYDQSFMTGISNLFGYDGFWGGLFGTLTAEPAKFTPTIVSQIASATDDTARTSYVYGDPVQTAINKVLYKMPGARKGLEPIIDQLGRETKNADTVAARAFNSFLNPAIVRSKNSNKAAEEMYRLYEETGEASAIPPVAEYYFNVDKERNIMTAEERTKYQKVFGQEAVKQVNSALNSSSYKKLSDAEKVDIVEDIYSYAKALARAEVSDYELSGNDAKAAEAEAKGIAAATYFIYKATGDLNGNGSINQEEAKKALDKLPLTKAQKATLWQLTNSQWSVKNNPYR